MWAECLRHQGRYSEATRALDQALPRYREGQAPSFHVRILLALAWCEVDLCRLGRAQECVDELGAILRTGEHLHLRLQSELVWGRILIASGQYEDAYSILAGLYRRAGVAGLKVISEHARALLAETLWMVGQHDDASSLFDQAQNKLSRCGDVPVLVEACIARARATNGAADPDDIFQPVQFFLRTQPSHVARLERGIAQGFFLQGHGRAPDAAFQEARAALDRIRQNLTETDQAALRVHPWARVLR